MKYLLAAALALTLATPALPHAGHDHGDAPAPAAPAAIEPSDSALPDANLPDADVIDQFGNHTRFREALGTGVYVLSFASPDCGEACDIADRALIELAGRRSDFPAPLRLITLTLDPARERPEELLARHRDLDAPDDWLRLTGDPADLLPLLTQLGAAEDQTPFVIVGHAARQEMTRLDLTPHLADEIHDLVEKLAR